MRQGGPGLADKHANFSNYLGKTVQKLPLLFLHIMLTILADN